MLDQTIELACDLFCVVAQFFKRALIDVPLIFGDVELAADFAGGGIRQGVAGPAPDIESALLRVSLISSCPGAEPFKNRVREPPSTD